MFKGPSSLFPFTFENKTESINDLQRFTCTSFLNSEINLNPLWRLVKAHQLIFFLWVKDVF